MYNDNVNDPRIKKLLQRLLAEDGAIFISIGDDENASLKMISNDVFGEKNFVDTVINKYKYSIKPLSGQGDISLPTEGFYGITILAEFSFSKEDSAAAEETGVSSAPEVSGGLVSLPLVFSSSLTSRTSRFPSLWVRKVRRASFPALS